MGIFDSTMGTPEDNHPLLRGPDTARSDTELIIMVVLDLLLLILRIVLLVYFAVQTSRQANINGKYSSEQSTKATFACLGLSYLSFFAYGSLRSAIDFTYLYKKDNPVEL